MIPNALLEEGQHLMAVCNSCRYCEGFCAVWKAMETRKIFVEEDLNYLSNLCHNCGECYYSCQYSPPHEFAINPPLTLAKLRVNSYETYAWPAPLAKAFRSNGMVVSLVMAVLIIGAMAAGSLLLGGRLFDAMQDGDFYQIVPHEVMVTAFSGIGGLAACAMLIGFLRFWKDVGESYRTLFNPAAIFVAIKDVLTLTNLDNDGAGCTFPTEKASESLRWFHQITLYAFLSCLIATSLGAFTYDALGRQGIPSYTSLQVIFGTLGGIGLIIGPVGMLSLMPRRNKVLIDEKQDGMDYAFILLLILIAATGLLLLALRQTGAMGTLILIHLGLVMTLFVTMPYGKFVHGIYRSGALLKWALERSRAAKIKEATKPAKPAVIEIAPHAG
jgi:citrate/tricarballylate utilization protein